MQRLSATSRNQWLLIVTVFLSVYGIGNIQLVQLSMDASTQTALADSMELRAD